MTDARDFFGYKHPDEEPGHREEAEPDDELAPPQIEDAVTLDDQQVIRRTDAGDMLGRVRQLPAQLADARRLATEAHLPEGLGDVDAVLVLAMGGSAIGAELVAGIAGNRLRVPLVVHRDYGIPAWAGKRTLVVAMSHSGETVETLSGVAEARRRGLPLLVVSTGGRLGADAVAAGTPYVQYRATGQPRAAVGFGMGLVHELLARIGLLSEPDPLGPAVEGVERLLDANAATVPTAESAAKQLAWSIFGRIPVVYGAGHMLPVAHRWKTQLNENSKSWAAYEPMPEANHNAIEGSFNPRELADAIYVVELRDPEEPSEIAERYAVVNELLGERATNRSVVWADGPSPLARALWMLVLGDLVSIYLAILYQTDPTPVTLLAMLKQRLARSTD